MGKNDLETYNRTAETVGMMPSLRWRDNLYQGIVVATCVLLFSVIGLVLVLNGAWSVGGDLGFWPGWIGLGVGALIGLVIGAFGSGMILMVLGLVRARGHMAHTDQSSADVEEEEQAYV